MIDLVSMEGFISSIQNVANIAKSLIDIHDASLWQSKRSELLAAVIAAQSSALQAQGQQMALINQQMTLINRVRDLEEEIRNFKAWESEKQRYELKDLGNRKFAYSLKESVQQVEPQHDICANCYNQSKKSILQLQSRDPGRHKVLMCQNCGEEIFLTGSRGPEQDSR